MKAINIKLFVLSFFLFTAFANTMFGQSEKIVSVGKIIYSQNTKGNFTTYRLIETNKLTTTGLWGMKVFELELLDSSNTVTKKISLEHSKYVTLFGVFANDSTVIAHFAVSQFDSFEVIDEVSGKTKSIYEKAMYPYKKSNIQLGCDEFVISTHEYFYKPSSGWITTKISKYNNKGETKWSKEMQVKQIQIGKDATSDATSLVDYLPFFSQDTLLVFKRVRQGKKAETCFLTGIDAKTGEEIFERKIENDIYVYTNYVSFHLLHTDTIKKEFIFSVGVATRDKQVKTSLLKVSLNGMKEIELSENNLILSYWEKKGDVLRILGKDDDGLVDGYFNVARNTFFNRSLKWEDLDNIGIDNYGNLPEGTLHFHKFILGENGRIYAVAEIYKSQTNVGGVALNTLSLLAGTYANAPTRETVVGSIYLFALNKDFKVDEFKRIIPKKTIIVDGNEDKYGVKTVTQLEDRSGFTIDYWNNNQQKTFEYKYDQPSTNN